MGMAANLYKTPMTDQVSGFDLDGGAAEDRPVDLVHLSRFTMGNRDLEREVLSLFRKQSALFIDRMRQAEDDQAWREAAHTMKGSARGIGAWAVGDAAQDAEQLTGESRLQFGAAAIAKIDRTFKEACQFIDGIL
ncbi:MAG: Hpt domain-containing protein [Hyphomicrobiales bacterium]|nr:MAG: Hpt domain-containing protein [Hyphomicrobiales bacterium]